MKIIRTSLVSAVVLSLTMWSAQSASAAQLRTLPTGNVIYGIDDNTAIGKVYSIDPLTSTPTALAGNSAPSPCGDSAYQSAYNPASGKAYFMCWNSPRTDLYELNLSTGAATLIGNIQDGSSVNVDAVSLAIDAQGNAFVYDQNALRALNLSTAVAGSVIGPSSGWNPLAFSFNPADQQFYVVNNTSASNVQLYKIDVSTGARTLLVSNAGFPITGSNLTKRVLAMAFDSNGTLWGINNNLALFSAVVTGTSAADFAGSVQIGAGVGSIDTYTIFAQNASPQPTPAPQPAPASNPTLANTGLPQSVIGQYAGFAVAMLIGGALLSGGALRLRRK